MRGLIIKDFLFLKNNWKNMIVLLIGSLLISIALGNYLLAITVVPIILLSSSINTFQTDEFFNTESFILSLPLSRKQIVKSRYIFTILMAVLAFFIGMIIYYLIQFTINPGVKGLNTDMIKYLIMLEASGLLVNSLFYPVIYKFGCEKSKLVLMSVVILLIGIASIISVSVNIFNTKIIDFVKVLHFIQNNGVYVICGIVTFTFIISYIISSHIYKKRDF